MSERPNLSDPAEVIIENEDVVLSNSGEIRQAIDRAVPASGILDTDDRMSDLIMIALAPQATGKQAAEIAGAVLNFVARASPQLIKSLADKNSSDDLVRYLRDLTLDYRRELRHKKFSDIQGERWWSYIDSDITYRSEAIGFRHHITVAQRERLQFDSDISGGVIFAAHFSGEVADAIESHREEAEEQINPDTIDSAIENLQRCSEQLAQLQEDQHEVSSS